MVTSLRCSTCGTEYEDRWRCTCGSPLDYADPPLPDGSAPRLSIEATRDGLWAFDEFLPMTAHATLGEGFTPLVDAPDWEATFKLEFVSPTGSFKDRGATTTISRAVECGADTVVDDSSGNAGAAIATYAARAGLDAEIYVPASVKAAKLKAIERVGATPVRVEGSRQDVTDACIEAVEDGDGWYASHVWNPAFFAGTATFAYEVAAQRGWTVPDAVVTPLGHGTLFLGSYRGFRALYDAGWTDSMPRLYGAQAAGYSPIADELHGPSEGGSNNIADGIEILNPARKVQILEAIDETGGDAIAIDTEATEAELASLHERGFYAEPTCAVAPAALERYRDAGEISPDDDVVVPLTGSGLKM
jgi:threonine synthase